MCFEKYYDERTERNHFTGHLRYIVILCGIKHVQTLYGIQNRAEQLFPLKLGATNRLIGNRRRETLFPVQNICGVSGLRRDVRTGLPPPIYHTKNINFLMVQKELK